MTEQTYGELMNRYVYNRSTAWQKVGGNLFVFVLFALIGYFYISADADAGPIVAFVTIIFIIPSSGPELIEGLRILWTEPKIEIYENGLLYTEKHRSTFTSWADIDDVQTIRNSFSVTNGLYKLYQNKKILLKLTDMFKDYRALNDAVIRGLVTHRDFQTVLNDGGTIQIGELTLTRDGIRAKNRELAWDQLRFIRGNTHLTKLSLFYDERHAIQVSTKKAKNVPVIFAFMVSKVEGEVQRDGVITPEQITAEIDATMAKFADDPESLHVEAFLARNLVYLELVIAIIALLLSLNVLIPGMRNAIEWDLMRGRWFLYAAPAFFLPLVCLWQIYLDSKQLYKDARLVVTPSGLEINTRNTQELWAWEDIQHITPMKVFSWFAFPRPTIHIVHSRNASFVLGPRFYNTFRASALLNKFYGDVRTPAYQRRLNQGEVLVFGAIRLDRTGLKYGRRHYTWAEIPFYEFKVVNMETQLVIYSPKRKKMRTIPIFRIENFEIFTRLLAENHPLPQAEENTKTD